MPKISWQTGVAHFTHWFAVDCKARTDTGLIETGDAVTRLYVGKQRLHAGQPVIGLCGVKTALAFISWSERFAISLPLRLRRYCSSSAKGLVVLIQRKTTGRPQARVIDAHAQESQVLPPRSLQRRLNSHHLFGAGSGATDCASTEKA
ncbi:hypothetical protein [Candidatus Aalborgicola defluviihabitans]|uniref:hypothetical protein n=1 Tax=Candidatus Aalborgicola defluviihabitans TaxID=3386187 RepID=UPI001DFABDF3|nr:hypothetical protein [Burkholderiales bacterium]